MTEFPIQAKPSL